MGRRRRVVAQQIEINPLMGQSAFMKVLRYLATLHKRHIMNNTNRKMNGIHHKILQRNSCSWWILSRRNKLPNPFYPIKIKLPKHRSTQFAFGTNPMHPMACTWIANGERDNERGWEEKTELHLHIPIYITKLLLLLYQRIKHKKSKMNFKFIKKKVKIKIIELNEFRIACILLILWHLILLLIER